MPRYTIVGSFHQRTIYRSHDGEYGTFDEARNALIAELDEDIAVVDNSVEVRDHRHNEIKNSAYTYGIVPSMIAKYRTIGT